MFQITEFTEAHLATVTNGVESQVRLHPIFEAIWRNVELQPVLLARAKRKAAGRRFSGVVQTGFDIGGIAEVVSERCSAVRDQEHADQLTGEIA